MTPDVTKPANVVVNLFGGVFSDPQLGITSWQRTINLCSMGKYRRMHRGSLNVSGSVTVPLGAVTLAHVLFARARSGALTLRLTTLLAIDQGIPLSGGSTAVWIAPVLGDELTQIKIVGTGDVDYLVAGD